MCYTIQRFSVVGAVGARKPRPYLLQATTCLRCRVYNTKGIVEIRTGRDAHPTLIALDKEGKPLYDILLSLVQFGRKPMAFVF